MRLNSLRISVSLTLGTGQVRFGKGMKTSLGGMKFCGEFLIAVKSAKENKLNDIQKSVDEHIYMYLVVIASSIANYTKMFLV